ncbi:MAG: DUF4112 domain-containing protein [Propionibacterium sp.]|nr:DUF4112 domain-containing protein [Propionibacterium sp.]
MDDVSKARATVRREPPERPAQLTRFMTHLLDDAVGVPGTNFRFGLDPVLSLVPGLGSSVGTLFGSVMIIDAIRLRAPIPVLARMGWNYLIDWLIGLIPGLGAVGDAFWHAHRRNLTLLNRTIVDREQVRQASIRYWIAAGSILVGGTVFIVTATIGLLVWLLGLLG